MSSILKGIVDEGGELVSVIYINDKPATKYVRHNEAEADASKLRAKFPDKKIEIKKEVRESAIPLKFNTTVLESYSDIRDYAIDFFNAYGIEKHHVLFRLNLKEMLFKKNILIETTDFNEIQQFEQTISKLSSKDTVKVGDMFAVLDFDIKYMYNKIEVVGFTTPKKIIKIKTTSDGNIEYVMFSDNDRYPRVSHKSGKDGTGMNHPAYFNTKDEAEKALTYLKMLLPESWEMDTSALNFNTTSDIEEDTINLDGAQQPGGWRQIKTKPAGQIEDSINESSKHWNRLGFDVRSTILWPEAIFESRENGIEFNSWLNSYRDSVHRPNKGDTCILAMIIFTGDEIHIQYGEANYVGENDSDYILSIHSGEHEYAKRNQIVFDSEKSFQHFLTVLRLRFGELKFNVTGTEVQETKQSYQQSNSADELEDNVKEDTAYASGMGQGGNAGESYRKFKPKMAGTHMKKESSIMKGINR